MIAAAGSSIHASCVLIGREAALIRGASGSGKSRLALALLRAGNAGRLVFSRLVADDRVLLDVSHGRLLARAVPELAGLLEVRGLGIRRVPYEPIAAVGLIVDLDAPGERMPDAAAVIIVSGVGVPRLTVAPSATPLDLIMAWLTTDPDRPRSVEQEK